MRLASSSAQAQASDSPSKVLVPRPISSMRTRECSVALCRMLAVSSISTMKVERPPARSSEAPMREKMRSTGPISALSAGTNEPDAAMSTMTAAWRMKVDLPPMFGPVMTSMRVLSSSRVSLGTKGASETCSTTGWRPAVIRMPASLTSTGRLSRSVWARSAWLQKRSSVATAAAVALSPAIPVESLSSSSS